MLIQLLKLILLLNEYFSFTTEGKISNSKKTKTSWNVMYRKEFKFIEVKDDATKVFFKNAHQNFDFIWW